MSLNENGVFYHLLGDAGGSITVIVSTVAIEITGIRIIDPIAALIAIVVIWSAVKVLRGSGAIFFHQMPFDNGDVREALLGIEGVERIDDFHAWQICSQITVATAHIETGAETMEAAELVTRRVHDELSHYGVDYATIKLCPAYKKRDIYLSPYTR